MVIFRDTCHCETDWRSTPIGYKTHWWYCARPPAGDVRAIGDNPHMCISADAFGSTGGMPRPGRWVRLSAGSRHMLTRLRGRGYEVLTE